VENPHVIIVVTSLILGIAVGVIMHRADYCVTGMFRDFFMFRDRFMLRTLVLLIVVAMILFELGRLGGLITLHPFPLLGPPSITTFIAACLFGVGMVLAGGCVVGTLYKLGAGSMVSLVAFVGLLAGSTLYAEFHPWWAALGKSSRLTDGITLPQALGVAPEYIIYPVIIMGLFYILYHSRSGNWVRVSQVEGYIQPWLAAVLIALIGFLSYLLVGMPLGITTSYAKLGATVESWFLPEHVNSLGYFTAVPMKYVPPLSDIPIIGGAGPALDGIAAIQYPLIVGVLVGAMVSAKRLGELKCYFRVPFPQYASAFVGGLMVGMAARMTPGCNIWHLWGGVPILAGQSLLFLLGLFPGAWLGSRLLVRYVLK
jgi:uncharacterized membrane protein YedE/YeeE